MTIGTRNESSLHDALKRRYAGADGLLEVEKDGFVCDACDGGGSVIEVQTGSFAPLQKKAAVLTANLAAGQFFFIVHPVVVQKYIEVYEPDGALTRRRKSPRSGSAWDLFRALVYAPSLVLIDKVQILLVFVEICEKRCADGKGSWRRKKVSITDHVLVNCHETLVLDSLASYRRFIPFKKGERFTVKKLAVQTGIKPALAGKAVYTLKALGLVECVGKEGRANCYQGTG
jgi:hypothetical protein